MAGRMTDNFETLADILKDKDIDMGRAALSLAALFHPDIKSGRYQNHLDKLVVETGYRHKELLDAGADDSIETRLAALKHIIADKHGYEGDLNDPGHIRNADLISVIDRGKGSPVGLCVIYIYVAMAQGWDVHGIDLPGYFAVRLDKKGERLLFDPCAQCRILGAPELRQIVKNAMGDNAELSAHYYDPVPLHSVLIRLQNQVKLRQIESEDYDAALKSVEAMMLIDPNEYRLLLDAGVLYAKTGKQADAVEALEDYISKAPDARDRQEAAILLQDVKDAIKESTS